MNASKTIVAIVAAIAASVFFQAESNAAGSGTSFWAPVVQLQQFDMNNHTDLEIPVTFHRNMDLAGDFGGQLDFATLPAQENPYLNDSMFRLPQAHRNLDLELIG